MIDVFLERHFETPLTADTMIAVMQHIGGCFDLHRVTWQGSLLAKDGRRMVCRFQSPDAESTRTALRQLGSDVDMQAILQRLGAGGNHLWPGTVHDAPGLTPEVLAVANVLVERSFSRRVSLEQVQALEDAGSACLQNHRVRFVRTYFSLDGKRMICLYQAPDAESVRLAQHQAGMPMDRVWAFQPILPGDNARV
ncbi:hypothetical protein L861_01750 [Litchfieldella anticariensis FP35 = DSM 16096]|uniref:DUF4242 domain-containing protein n=1 Tax=Litchfieldella anticariensis (strain DSM 16096 / CECT 5854 / CIP 108499 / LMG 22089 / FP35) TaxID=1121939 RepID=S2KQ95_LITA3|nr:DUF4242 domain-containing protein [Halomonas anticariensis]EPC04055.1 hypothetical protein L861_01750 [Halomonas anticariensis FP35 = DSM 16096]